MNQPSCRAAIGYSLPMPETTGQRAWRALYSGTLRLALPFSLYHLIWRGLRQREYFDRWSERFAFYRDPGLGECLWLHAVSVGEVNAAAPLLAALRRAHPGREWLVSTTTPTGSARARALWGDSVRHAYLPYDLPGAVRSFLDQFRPRLGIVMETEIWPNLYAELRRRSVPVLIANARLSERSLRGYRLIAPLLRAALAGVQRITAQSRADADRYLRLGASPSAVCVTGNLKFDQAVPDGIEAQARIWRGQWGARPVWIAASTHEDEEPMVLAAHRAVLERWPQALLLWAPRHPERFSAVTAAGERAGFRLRTRREHGLPERDSQVFVIDTLGELMAFYAAADLAFVGGSLQPVGGHNLLEPAALGLPVLVGPHTFNFVDIAALLARAGALRQVQDGPGLASALVAWLADPELMRRLGDQGRTSIASERGALAKTVDIVAALLKDQG